MELQALIHVLNIFTNQPFQSIFTFTYNLRMQQYTNNVIIAMLSTHRTLQKVTVIP